MGKKTTVWIYQVTNWEDNTQSNKGETSREKLYLLKIDPRPSRQSRDAPV